MVYQRKKHSWSCSSLTWSSTRTKKIKRARLNSLNWLEKAYDSVSLSFLEQVKGKGFEIFGFTAWCKKNHSEKVCISVNREMGLHFITHRGLRQGDPHLLLRMKTVELGRKPLQPFSTFTFEIQKRKQKRTSRTRKRTRTYGISRISETNQFERNYVEHGRYAKIQYEIPTHTA